MAIYASQTADIATFLQCAGVFGRIQQLVKVEFCAVRKLDGDRKW